MVETALLLGSASTATAASTAGLFGAAGSFSLGATLSTLGTGFSVLSLISGGQAANVQSKSQALQNDFNARQEAIRGKEEAASIKLDVARALASANARGAASGIDISSGSPVTAQKEALRSANNALSTAGTNAKLREEAERQQANINRARGRNSVRAGYTQAASLLGDFASFQGERGVF